MTTETKDLPPVPDPVGWLTRFVNRSGLNCQVLCNHNSVGDYRDIDPGATSERVYSESQMHAYALEAIRASATSAPEHGWQPIETAPKQGVFLVYLPTESEDYRVQNMTRRHKMTTIGDAFSFDKAPATHWQPLPPPPGTTPQPAEGET